MKTTRYAILALLSMALVFAARISTAESALTQPWFLGVEAGKLDTEGDADVNDAYAGTLVLDYNLSDALSLEGSLTFVPELKGNYYDDYSSGARVRVNRLEARTGETETWALGAAVDALYHLAPRQRCCRPYLSAGLGILRYGEDIGENDGLDITPRLGAGLIHPLTDRLVLRADFRYFVAGTFVKSESNSKLDIGVAWALGAKQKALAPAVAAPPPAAQAVPETPKRQEPPAEPVPAPQTYEEELHELHIEFAAGSAVLEAQYHEQLDVIGKLLKDAPAATAKIEGHCDQRRGDVETQAGELTRKRAEAVRDYLAGGKWKIARNRMEAVGRGFGQPKEAADLDKGNIANRRIVIRIRRPAAAKQD